MEAGMSAMNSKAQMRNQLLQSDVGNIDLAHEVPTGQPPHQQYPQMPHRPVPQQYGQNRYAYEDPERRAYSMNQKSISGFFKNRGGMLGHRKGRHEGSKDDDEEVMVDDGMSMVTFNDIRTSQNRGGERYGHGSDTAPIIPTLVTQSHNNMNNVEYRKHMTAQRKFAMNAMAKQQKPDARAMSLQGYGNPYMPHPQVKGSNAPAGPYGNPRANSLMHPPPQFQRGRIQPYGPAGGPPPPAGGPNREPRAGGPRAMSLMSPYSRPPNMRPQNESFQPSYQVHRQQGLSAEPARGGSTDFLNHPPQTYRQPLDNSVEYLPTRSVEPFRQPQEKSLVGSSENLQGRPSSSQPGNYPPVRSLDPTASLQAEPGTGAQLNVLQLSAPHQKDLREKEQQLAERERELREKERLIKEQEARIGEKLHQQERKQGPQPHLSKANADDVNLDPSPTLESGLKSLSVNDHAEDEMHNRVSMGTFVSAFSESPEKRRNMNSSGLYKLEKHDDNAFVTAQEFPSAAEGRSSEARKDTIAEEDTTLTGIDVRESRTVPEADGERMKKRSSFIKAKDFLRKLSSQGSTKDADSQVDLNRTPSRASLATASGSDASQYRPSASRRPSTVTLRKNKTEDDLAKAPEINDDPDAFVFDNTVGKPYVPSFTTKDEVVESNKFKTITISGEQLNILTENRELMSELTLISSELAESIKRETILEEQIRTMSDPSQAEVQLSLADFEIELRKKSSKIVELIQELNNERLKRFIAEEQVLLSENGVKPSAFELVNRITTLEALVAAKDNEIQTLKDQLH